MTELLQSGHHPDADLIGAFVEHALPAHEQAQMLDHLAVCPECRATVALSVALSQPAVEEMQRPAQLAARKAWWSGWSDWSGWAVAWPAAAAVVALAIFAVFVHRAANAPGAAVSTRIAGTHLPPSPVSPPVSRAPSAEQPPRGSKVQPTAVHPADSNRAASAGERRTARAPEPREPRNALPQGNIAPPAPTASFGAASSANSVVLSNGAGSAGALGNGAGNGFGPGVGAIAGSGANSSDSASIQLKNPEQPRPVAAAAMPKVAPAPPEQTATGQSVVVVAGSLPMETEATNVANNIVTTEREVQAARLTLPLPSRRPVLSTVSRGDRVLAVDTHNKVFLSTDGGQHWKGVHVVWRGRAMRVDLTGLPIRNRNAEFQIDKARVPISTVGNVPQAASANVPVVLQGRSLAALTGPGLSGMVTDVTGAVIPGATVTISDTATRETRTARTDGAGHYAIEQLPPGTYRVEAQAPGFMTRTNTAVAVAAGSQSVANLSLAVGAVTQQVEVTSGAPTIATVPVNPASMDSLSTNGGVAGSVGQNAGPAGLFEITTEKGDRWTSSDGVSWKRVEAGHPASN